MHLKEFQESVLEKLDYYLQVLKKEFSDKRDYVEFQKTKGKTVPIEDYCKGAWVRLTNENKLPTFKDKKGISQVPLHNSKKDGLGNFIPNICFKVPTGGGKTLLGAHAIERINEDYFSKHTGLVLWIVPTEAIYKQTIKNFKDRNHPYRQTLERTSAGKVKILEKTNSFSTQDLEEYLCVMIIMLQSTNRETKESLRVFKDSGHFINFFPQPDDYKSNSHLVELISNLDIHESNLTLGGVKRNSVKHSLGNAIRIARPIVILDEGHRAYSDLAKRTVCTLNPKFILELSATPHSESNILVNVSGSKLKDEEMIKLPINIINSGRADWKKTLHLACEKIRELEKHSQKYHKNKYKYIRPIMLIQVERTGKEQRDKKFIHSEHVKEYLIQKLKISEESIKIKTAERNELKDESLLSETSQVKFIITKQALQEGWDCPFAYVLTILSNAQSKKALTQLIGRVLRQPYAEETNIQPLNESYVFCYNRAVTEIVEGIRKGLQKEGMGDLLDSIRGTDASTNKIKKVKRRKEFKNLNIFLPKVLHKNQKGWRDFIYEEDILQQIDFSKLSYSKKDELNFNELESLKIDLIKLDIEDNKGQFNLPHIEREKKEESIEMDYPYIISRLSNVIPNPWEATRVFNEVIESLESKNIPSENIYLHRKHLLESIENDIQDQMNKASEKIFINKLEKGEILFRVIKKPVDLNWIMPEEMNFILGDGDKVLRRRDDTDLQMTLFSQAYKKDFNDYEEQVALYLDEEEAIRWWHRIVSRQDYYLQGWQKRKVYPDFLAYIDGKSGKVNKLSVLETKGDQLKGNEDTEYKKKLFKVLEKHANKKTISIGELETASNNEERKIFKILMQKNWQDDIAKIVKD